MLAYKNIVSNVLLNGVRVKNRTEIDSYSIPGCMFEHNMEDGFPLLTTKFVPFKLVASELEFFIKGYTDKKWLQERNNHIWDEWCSNTIVEYGTDEETKRLMKNEIDLGPIYGWQWRNFGAKYMGYENDRRGKGIDQLFKLVDTLHKNHTDRRMIVTAWNPIDIHKMALPPCHYSFQVIVHNEVLSLLWNQRSVDVALGLPFNIASYGLLLHLLCLESGYKEGKLIGFLGDTHIYVNHLQKINEQIDRECYPLPLVSTNAFKSIFTWQYSDSFVCGYKHHDKINYEIAI